MPQQTIQPMTEEVIESMFSSSDWKETLCAHCTEYDSCVSMADVPTCYGCLEKYYDANGDELPVNVYKPVETPHGSPINPNLLGAGVVLASAFWGVAIGNLVMEVAKRI
jgi:hypothetical protein